MIRMSRTWLAVFTVQGTLLCRLCCMGVDSFWCKSCQEYVDLVRVLEREREMDNCESQGPFQI